MTAAGGLFCRGWLLRQPPTPLSRAAAIPVPDAAIVMRRLALLSVRSYTVTAGCRHSSATWTAAAGTAASAPVAKRSARHMAAGTANLPDAAGLAAETLPSGHAPASDLVPGGSALPATAAEAAADIMPETGAAEAVRAAFLHLGRDPDQASASTMARRLPRMYHRPNPAAAHRRFSGGFGPSFDMFMEHAQMLRSEAL